MLLRGNRRESHAARSVVYARPWQLDMAVLEHACCAVLFARRMPAGRLFGLSVAHTAMSCASGLQRWHAASTAACALKTAGSLADQPTDCVPTCTHKLSKFCKALNSAAGKLPVKALPASKL
jgi:hypothetical protein